MKKLLAISFFTLSSVFFTLCNAQYTDVFDFNGTNGSSPQGGRLVLSGNMLYGMTGGGGVHSDGNVFAVDTNGNNYKDLLDFNGTSTPYGENPVGSLTLSGTKLFGMTSEGGKHSYGYVFSIDTNGNNYKDLVDFNGTSSPKGEYPQGDLTIIGNKLYGMSGLGVFSIDTNGSNFKQLQSADGIRASLTLSEGTLYGVAQGGANNDGFIFSIDTNGGSYKDLYDFSGSNNPNIEGKLVYASGVLYGMAEAGGVHDSGFIFSIDTNGSGYQDIADFTKANGNGFSPFGSLTLSPSGTILYGETNGIILPASGGNIFSIETNGSNFKNLLNFKTTNARLPLYGSLIITGNTLYGMTNSGGVNGDGVVFSFKTDELYVSANTTTNVSCNGGNNGSASSSVSGGTLPYTYLWNDANSQTNTAATGLLAEAYTLTVTDNTGNSATASVIISAPSALSISASTNTNVSCNGGNNGSATVVPSNGTLPYSYSWNDGNSQTTAMATGLSAGNYIVTVFDSCGGSQTAPVLITQPNAIIVSRDSVPAALGNNGIAAVTVSGGILPYTYLWTPGNETTDTIKGLSAGSYCCSINDANGCSQTVCITISNCANSFVEPICIVTIDTATNKSEVIWGRTNSPSSGGIGAYNIYKDDGSGFVLLHDQPLDSLSEFVDATSDPSADVQSYKLSTVDSCGESALSAVSSSILLTTTSGTHAYILSWTAYVGFTPERYRILRGPSMSRLTQIDSVANNVYTYVDSFPPPNVFYVLEAVNPSGSCIPSTHGPNAHNLSISLLSGAFSNGFNTAILGTQNIGTAVSKLNIYPNPSNGIVTLNYFVNGSDNVQINIINELGQQIYMEQKQTNNGTNSEQLNLGNLASGIYSLRIQTNSGLTVRKLVIMGNK